jgi:hypothetical protein
MMYHDFKSPLLPLFASWTASRPSLLTPMQRGKLLAMPPWAAQGFISAFEALTQ